MSSNITYILGIETSFDDTSAALLANGKVVTNIVKSKAGFTGATGGVIPEQAARTHAKRIVAVINEALQPLLKKNPALPPAEVLRRNKVTIAVSYGPGMVGPLLVGLDAAKALTWAASVSLMPVNHLEAHVLASSASVALALDTRKIVADLPALCLLATGGNTQLVLVKKIGSYEIVGRTRDDAAGEAFDKIARLLGLGFPGGPAIAAQAEKFLKSNPKSDFRLPTSEKLPRPMLYTNDFDFSFAGLKTAVATWLKTNPPTKANLPSICYEVQEAITDVLVSKALQAAEKYSVRAIWLTGGVAANLHLREKLAASGQKAGLPVRPCPLALTNDNAAMVALAAFVKPQERKLGEVRVNPNLTL